MAPITRRNKNYDLSRMIQDSLKGEESHTGIGLVGLGDKDVETNGLIGNGREGVAKAVLVLSVNLGLVVEGA